MFSIFNSRPKDVKEIRSAILLFIKEQLQKYEGGEGSNIINLNLYITCSQPEKQLYEAALYINYADKFKNEEVQKIADDYMLALPEGWTMQVFFTDTAPAGAYKAKQVWVALSISTTNEKAGQEERQFIKNAMLRTISGETEKEEYLLAPQQRRINIGREKKTTISDGSLRENNIAFIAGSANNINRSVSRQHAHIEWNAGSKSFMFFADEGGIPPNNKTKVKPANGQPVKLQTIEAGYQLQDGDQLILGESAVLIFSTNNNS